MSRADKYTRKKIPRTKKIARDNENKIFYTYKILRVKK